MYREDLEVYLAVISHKRSLNVAKMKRLIGDATWYVGAGEGLEYRVNGARNFVESGGLVDSRNRAMDDAFAKGYICVQLSDDLTRLRLWKGKKGEPEAISFSKALKKILAVMSVRDCKLAGTAITDNPFFSSGQTKEKGFILGDFMVIKPSVLRFDTTLRLKEDYDYSLQHIDGFGSVARVESILPSFAHRDNKGGAVSYRTSDLEKEAIAYLMKKWPGKLRLNARREDEVLMV